METTKHKPSTEELFELKQNYRDANKAVSLAAWSYIGLVIPLIGWILAGYSLSLTSTLPRTGTVGTKVKNARRNAMTSIVLSIIVLFAGVGLYIAGVNELNKQEEQKKQTEYQQGVQKFHQRLECLANAEKTYNQYLELNSTNTTVDSNGQKSYLLPIGQSEYANNKFQTDKDACYKTWGS